MKRKRIEYALQDALDNETLIHLRRKGRKNVWDGYVVGLSDQWVLLHEVERVMMRLNGYTAFRVKDIQAVREADTFAVEALRLRQERPVPQPDILLVDLPGLLSSADAHFPLVSVFREAEFPNDCDIGRILRTSARKVTARWLNRYAEWDEPVKLRLNKITRVGFGDGYAMALYEVEQARRQEKR